MKTNHAEALWNEICYLLSGSIKPEISERDYELQVVRAIEKLGWSEYLGEIEKQLSIQYGRNGLRPDIVVCDSKKNALIPVEVKRPAEDLSNEKIDGQLKSYMLQLKAKFGLVVGDSIKLFYDGAEKNDISKDPILLKEISFSPSFFVDGVDFVLNINKDSLLNGSYGKYIEKLIGRVRAKQDINQLKELLKSEETLEKIKDFLRREYSEFGTEIVDKALDAVSIKLSVGGVETPLHPPKKKTIVPTGNESILDMVHNLIIENENGISRKKIEEISKLTKRQIANVIYKLSKQNKIKSLDRGVYIVSNVVKNEPNIKKSLPSKPVVIDLPPGNLLKAYKAVCRKKKGSSVEELEYKSGLFGRQLSNALYKLKKRGLIENLEKGTWVATAKLQQTSKSTKTNKKSIKKASSTTSGILESIYSLIRKYKGGIDVQSIREKMQLEDRQVSNALYKLSKKGMVESVGRGKYVAI